MTINRNNIAKELIPGLNAVLGMEYGKIDDQHTKIYDIENSKRSFEEETMFTGLGTAPVKNEGSGVAYDEMQETYTARYQHETIALAFAITEEAMEDNLYDTFSKARAGALGRSMANTKQIKAVYPFNNGFATTNFALGDGAAFFSASHPTVGAGNQSNTGGAVDLSETTLQTAYNDITFYRDERGILINAIPEMLLIPPALRFTAFKILKSDLSTTTATNSTTGVTNVNDVNALRAMGFFPKGMTVNQRLTDTNAWFIRTNVPNGTKMFVRKPLQATMEGDFDTGNMRYKARERYSFGVSDFRQWYGASGSS